jgi:hypothetical protein
MRDCGKCHGWREVEYHPDNYKTKPCGIGSKCPNKHYCYFYHNESEKISTKKNKKDPVLNKYFIIYIFFIIIEEFGYIFNI